MAAALRSCMVIFIYLLTIYSTNKLLLADGPTDNIPTNVRPIPPVGITLGDETRNELLQQLETLEAKIAQSSSSVDKLALPEVLVFSRAVRLALEQSIFYTPEEVQVAKSLMQYAEKRLTSLSAATASNESLQRSANGETPKLPTWLSREMDSAKPAIDAGKPMLVVGGFRSKIDDSVQPYGLVLPPSYFRNPNKKWRLDIWLHGRGEKVSELAFLHQRMRQVGECSPDEAIVLHPYGRYCNAFKFAGEIDVLEAMQHVQSILPIDQDRISIRGFSMGGAGCWQLAVHYPDLWFAATPGAGFSETRQFLSNFQQESFQPTDDQLSLLHWYDCPDWANNLRYLPTIAYSGELDKQKQAADVMEKALAERGITLPHIIGPQTAHKIHPESKVDIESRLTKLAAEGRKSLPTSIDFTTYSLRYFKHSWIELQELQQHWNESRIQAYIESPRQLVATTKNIARFKIRFDAKQMPFEKDNPITLEIDQQKLVLPKATPGQEWQVELVLAKDRWTVTTPLSEPKKTKRPGLQGPIDDAFMSAFLFVAPNPATEPNSVDRWAESELSHASEQWRRHFRGDIRMLRGSEITTEELENNNLILFGTPQTNAWIAKALATMPIQWNQEKVAMGSQEWTSRDHALVAIYPSPFADNRYVVFNSGFTFREYAYLNNARQIAMLPDWAIVDTSKGSNSQYPGLIRKAGFFDEAWSLPK